MTLYSHFLFHLVTVSLVLLPGLFFALAITRYSPLAPLAKVWILRSALVGSLFALLGIGIPIAVRAGSSDGFSLELSWLSLAVGLYAAGAIMRGWEFLSDLRAVRHLYRHSTPAPFEAQRMANRVAMAMGLPQSPPVRSANGGESVLLVAARRATIMLPVQRLEEETLRLALAHEMAHVRHRDLFWLGIAGLVRCLLWFHPGIDMAVHRLVAAQEAAADRAALLATATPTRRYAEMLIEIATAKRNVPLSLTTAASVREDLEERIRSLYAPRPARWAIPLAAIAMVLAAIPIRPIGQAEGTASPTEQPARVFAPARLAAPMGV
jgi:beta-lactamase regulating signal transducer with metallopeptidase domain